VAVLLSLFLLSCQKDTVKNKTRTAFQLFSDDVDAAACFWKTKSTFGTERARRQERMRGIPIQSRLRFKGDYVSDDVDSPCVGIFLSSSLFPFSQEDLVGGKGANATTDKQEHFFIQRRIVRQPKSD
jgi:hypothetical protein